MLINVVIELLYYSNRLARDDELNDEYKWKNIHFVSPKRQTYTNPTHTQTNRLKSNQHKHTITIFILFYVYRESVILILKSNNFVIDKY